MKFSFISSSSRGEYSSPETEVVEIQLGGSVINASTGSGSGDDGEEEEG